MFLKYTEENRKWWILAAMTTTVSMIFVDLSVLPVALPTLQRDLDISNLGLQWTLNIYTLVLAALVLAGGKLADRWGLKKAFCCGVMIFALASALCGLAFTGWWLIFSRALQGIGGALLLPATQGIIISHFPPHQRGKALGLFVSIGSVFLAMGPLIGGAFTTYLSWRYVFWINLPIAAIGFLLAYYVVPPMPGKRENFDWRGFFFLSVGIACIVIALMQAQDWGWASLRTLPLLCIGLYLLIFLFRRKHKPHASILDFELMRKRSFLASSGAIFCTQFLTTVAIFWAIYFQNILNFSPYKAGGYAFMANVPVLFGAPLGGFLVDRFGPKLPVMTGFTLICFSLVWFVIFQNHESIELLLPTLITFGLGISMIYTPSFASMMNEVPAEKRGAASGISSTLRQCSASLGLAFFGTVYSLAYLGKLGKALLIDKATVELSPRELEGVLSKAPGAMDRLNHLSAGDATYVVHSAKTAFLDAFFWINLIGAGFAFAGIVFAFRMMRNTACHRNAQMK